MMISAHHITFVTSQIAFLKMTVKCPPHSPDLGPLKHLGDVKQDLTERRTIVKNNPANCSETFFLYIYFNSKLLLAAQVVTTAHI